MDNFNVVDHGVREEMKTGSVRDTQNGKPRFDLVPATCLTKLALHYGAGSEKYGDRNWEKGQPITRYMSSAERHFQYFKMGLTDENHLMACVWNLFCIDWTLDQIKAGKLPKELDDRTPEMLGSEICTSLFSDIEKNIKKKLEKCAKIDEKEPEKVTKIDGLGLLNIINNSKKTIDNKDNAVMYCNGRKADGKGNGSFNDEAICLGGKRIPVISKKDDAFAVGMIDGSGYFCISKRGRGFYSNDTIDFFDVFCDKNDKKILDDEIKRLDKNGIKYVVISESMFNKIACENCIGIVYGYDEEADSIVAIGAVDDFYKFKISKENIEKYKSFTIGVFGWTDMTLF